MLCFAQQKSTTVGTFSFVTEAATVKGCLVICLLVIGMRQALHMNSDLSVSTLKVRRQLLSSTSNDSQCQIQHFRVDHVWLRLHFRCPQNLCHDQQHFRTFALGVYPDVHIHPCLQLTTPGGLHTRAYCRCHCPSVAHQHCTDLSVFSRLVFVSKTWKEVPEQLYREVQKCAKMANCWILRGHAWQNISQTSSVSKGLSEAPFTPHSLTI